MPLWLTDNEIENLAAILQAEPMTPHDALSRAVGRPIERPWDLGQLDTEVLVRLLCLVEQCTMCGTWTRTTDLVIEMPDDALCPRCA